MARSFRENHSGVLLVGRKREIVVFDNLAFSAATHSAPALDGPASNAMSRCAG
jgi:hypothetical protein